MRVVKIKNCDYKIPEGEMMSWVSYYGTPQSPVIEDCFEDPDCDDGFYFDSIESCAIVILLKF